MEQGRKVPEMKRNSKWNWLVTLTAIAIFSMFSTGNVQAWGPLCQTAIAQAAQHADGMPQITGTRNFVLESSMPKVFEYTDQSYANLSYDFTEVMADNVQGMTDFCQVLAWGSAQTAEKTGDALFLQVISANTLDRWVNELLCDSLLYSIESPFLGTAVAEVAVMPKLVSDATVEYTDTFGGEAIGGADAVLAAHFQAHVLIGEQAILDSVIFQNNAKALINGNDWTIAMNKSVENVVDYVISSTQPQTGANWLVSDASHWGTQLLGKIGSLLVATGDAAIANQHSMGVYSYRVDLLTDRVNEITLNYLYNVRRNMGENLTMRQLAGRLYDLMTEDVIEFGGGGAIPELGPFSLAE